MSQHNIIYIGGFGRSGSTLLERVLGHNKNIIPTGELSKLSRIDTGPLEDSYDGLSSFWKNVLSELGWSKNERLKAKDLQDRVESAWSLFTLPHERTIRKYERRQSRIFNAIHQAAGKENAWIIDSSKTAHRQALRPFRLRRIANVKMIHLVRSGPSCMHSLAKNGSNRKLAAGQDPTVKHPYLHAAFGWGLANTAAALFPDTPSPENKSGEASRPENPGYNRDIYQYLQINYEEFVKNPERILDLISEFLEVDLSAEKKMAANGIAFPPVDQISGNRLKTEENLKIDPAHLKKPRVAKFAKGLFHLANTPTHLLLKASRAAAEPNDFDPRDKPVFLITSYRAFSVARSRLPIIRDMAKRGYRVVVVASPDDGVNEIADAGGIVEPVDFESGTLGTMQDLKVFLKLLGIYQKYDPVLVNNFNPKAVALSSVISYLFPKAKVVNTITGLGQKYVADGSRPGFLANLGYRVSFVRSSRVIFQNGDDLYEICGRQKILSPEKATIIESSGVDTQEFRPAEEKHDPPTVIMVSRLVKSKGVGDFVSAAASILALCPHVQLLLAGELSENHPDGVNREYIEQLVRPAGITYLGFRSDVGELVQKSSVLVHPQRYREGVPRTVLEAQSMAVPVVTTNTPGCWTACKHEETGIVVPPKDPGMLADAIIYLLQNPDTAQEMGENGRRFVQNKFDIHAVCDKYIRTYQNVGAVQNNDKMMTGT